MSAVLLRPDFSRGHTRVARSVAPTKPQRTRLLLTDETARLNAERRWSRTIHQMLSIDLADMARCALLDKLQLMIGNLCEAADAAYGALSIRDKETGKLDFAITHGERRGNTDNEDRRHDRQDALLQWVATSPETLRIPGPTGPIRGARQDGVVLDQQQDCLMAAPVSEGEHNLGVIQIEDKRGALNFDGNDVVKLELSCHFTARVLYHLARC